AQGAVRDLGLGQPSFQHRVVPGGAAFGAGAVGGCQGAKRSGRLVAWTPANEHEGNFGNWMRKRCDEAALPQCSSHVSTSSQRHGSPNMRWRSCAKGGERDAKKLDADR